MTRSSRQATLQTCPNCGKGHDVSIFVSGQKIACACGIRFEVKRTDVSVLNMKGEKVSAVSVDLALTTPSRQGPRPADTQVSSPPPEVPGYELIELLGRGGMGEVWKARQLSLEREVAIKLLPERFAQDGEFVRRFEKEATALAALSHPNIVQIIDRGKAGPHYFFVMELVPGINLREMLQAGRLEAAPAFKIMAQVARAIDAAHERQVVHRDLKPENVLVDPRGHVKIADFGLAGIKGSSRDIALTATAVAMGTVNYMAPEQRRDAKNVDHKADLYSLGVILYEVLTGELPLGRFKLPSALRSELPESIDGLVGALLETEPSARPQRGLEVAMALESLLSTPRVAASSLPSVPDFKPQQRGAWKVGLGVLAVLLATGLGVRLWPSVAPASEAPPAWYADSDEELFTERIEEAGLLKLPFDSAALDGGEEINTHSGLWQLEGGRLAVMQFGGPTDLDENPVLKPRAYVAHRYFSTDDFMVEADVEASALSDEFPPLPTDAQRFAEVCLRIKDLQVSVFSMPGVGMRLAWRYFTSDGREIVGNSAQDLTNLVEDEMRVPPGAHRVKLVLKRQGKGGGVMVEAFVNGVRFAKKVLDGLAGQTGKVAFGCRNLKCGFDDVVIDGKRVERPSRAKAQE